MARHDDLWRQLLAAEAPAQLSPVLYRPGTAGRAARRATPIWRRARGVWVEDVRGRRYLDFVASFGASSVGHAHPAVVRAVRRQSRTLIAGYGDVHPHELRVRVAKRLASLLPGRSWRVLWAQSGSEAVELALKSAYLASGRSGVLAFHGAYHGDSLGALGVSGFPAFRRPFAGLLRDDTVRAHYPDCERCPLQLRYPECGIACIEEAVAAADRHGGRRRRVGAVLVEPIQGRGGVIVPPPGALARLQERARERGWLLILDEIFTGLGRTGRLFAFQHDGLRPDLVCIGKGLGGGLPAAAVLGRRAVLDAWSQVESDGEAAHSATFLAHPLSLAAAEATLEVLERDRLAERAGKLGASMLEALRELARHYPSVRSVRGRGLLAGLEFWGRPVPLATARRRAERVVAEALRRGLLLLPSGRRGTVVQLCPPLTIRKAEWRLGWERLQAALDTVSKRDD